MLKKDIKKLDKEIKLRCLANDGYKCVICGKGKEQVQLHHHHIVGRRHRSLRWVLENVVTLCASHHVMGVQSAHEDPVWFMEEIRDIKGEKWYKELKILKEKVNKKSYEENMEMIELSLGEIINKYK